MNYETMFEHLVRDNPEIKKILLKLYLEPERATKWLLVPKAQLNGVAPAELLELEPNRVLDLLNQIQRGDFS
ncbi:hypothetical protein BK026_09335 [Alteromonas sp. V450]|uniref:antitoxin Xre/MbcA/ParS toxin-binding domain-containing protein n=1 Tax=Alteromonas sp. V450 TaxID=1912139 RepID=UPI0008FF3FAE|nr:antitoxin Xre/MbcA/ParS toxin-binding domain-containing protein [Alteromonas sp. V450]OJF68980.1 hypothetical protein BK026_09335 [Alteromonas sp. V450]